MVNWCQKQSKTVNYSQKWSIKVKTKQKNCQLWLKTVNYGRNRSITGGGNGQLLSKTVNYGQNWTITVLKRSIMVKIGKFWSKMAILGQKWSIMVKMVNYGPKRSIMVKNVQFRTPTSTSLQTRDACTCPRTQNFFMGWGQTRTETHGRTLRLLDRIGPVGRFGENSGVGQTMYKLFQKRVM